MQMKMKILLTFIVTAALFTVGHDYSFVQIIVSSAFITALCVPIILQKV